MVTKGQFQLQPSRIALVLQLSMSVMITLMTAQLWPWWGALLFWFALLSSYYYLRPCIPRQLEHLEHDTWVILQPDHSTVYAELKNIIDHRLYIVLFFERQSPICIWYDQLSKRQWQRLKILAQLF